MTTTSTPAYQRLTQQVQSQIDQVKRQVGDKMPSLRQFAQQNAVSMTTAIRCYEQLDLEQLEALAQQRVIKACLITSSHQNPTGHSISVEQKRWLADFSSRMEIPIIEDDVFCELSHQGPMPLPIKAWDNDGWVIWCSSVSKSLAPGLRLGWCQSGRFLNEMVKQRYLTTMGINQPLQEGLAEFINSGHYARHLSKINSLLYQQVIDYHQFLTGPIAKGVNGFDPIWWHDFMGQSAGFG
jgi:DNA-binding transcriptional MocR family regulator